MKMTTRGIAPLLATGALLLAGCASPGGYGPYPEQGYGQPAPGYPAPGPGYPAPYGSQWQGTVEGLDPRAGRILVVVDDPRSGPAERVEVRYDERTRLFYQGRESEVEGLERGDVIRFDAARSGNALWARTIDVVRNVRDGGGYGGPYGDRDPDGAGNPMRGAVAFVDPPSRSIRLDGEGYPGDVQVTYDARTTVEYRGRAYRPEDLERGDRVWVQARPLGQGRWLAERIVVERSIRE